MFDHVQVDDLRGRRHVGAARRSAPSRRRRGRSAAANISAVSPFAVSFAFTSAPVVEQRLDRLGVARPRRQHQRRRAGRSSRHSDRRRPSSSASMTAACPLSAARMQRRVAAEPSWSPSRWRRRRAASAPARRRPARRPVQRRHAVALRGVDVGALLQQRAHGVLVALHRRIGDRRVGVGAPSSDAATSDQRARSRQRTEIRAVVASSATSGSCLRSRSSCRRLMLRSNVARAVAELLQVVEPERRAAASASRWPSACRRRP